MVTYKCNRWLLESSMFLRPMIINGPNRWLCEDTYGSSWTRVTLNIHTYMPWLETWVTVSLDAWEAFGLFSVNSSPWEAVCVCVCEREKAYILTWNSVRTFDWAPLRRAVSHYVGVMGAGWRGVHRWSGSLLLEQLLWDFKEKNRWSKEGDGESKKDT